MPIIYVEDTETLSKKERVEKGVIEDRPFASTTDCDAECGATGHCAGIVRQFFVIGPGGGAWGWRNYCESMAEGPNRALHRLYIVGPTQLSLF